MTPDENDTGAAVRGIQPHSQLKDVNKDRSTLPQRQLDLELKSKGPTRSFFFLFPFFPLFLQQSEGTLKTAHY